VGGGVSGHTREMIIFLLGVAREKKVVAFSIEHRKAPVHPFPAANDDVYFWVKWIAANAAKFHGDPEKNCCRRGKFRW